MIDITIRITGDELGEVERAVLAALSGQPLLLPRLEEPTAEQAAAAKDLETAAAEVPKRTRRTKAEMGAARAEEKEPEFTDAQAAEEPEPPVAEEPEPPVAEEPVAEPSAAPSSATLEDAVKKATELVAANRVGELKSVLTAMGARRVSELKGDQIGVFLGKFAA